MTAVNFADILSKTKKDAPEPKPLPQGMYLAMVQGIPELPPEGIGKNGTPGAYVNLKIIQPQADVDRAALAEAGGLENATVRMTLWLSEKSLYRVFEFAEHLGIEVPDEGKSLSQIFSEMPNRQIYVTLSHTPSKDGKRLFNEIASTAKV